MSAAESDLASIRSCWRWLSHTTDGVSEVRVLQQGGGVVGIGFFDKEDAFVDACARSNILGNVYVGIQPRSRALLELATNTLRPLRAGARLEDVSVVVGTVIDIDPVRSKNTASTQAELDLALEAAAIAVDWCVDHGLRAPCRVMSGNGVQLWFAVPPIVLEHDERDTVRANLRSFEAELRAVIETEFVRVDSIHDLARIIKVVGTVSQKGEHTVERPHRVSCALDPLDRHEDPMLRQRLLSASKKQQRRLPIVSPRSEARAARTVSGELQLAAPVAMCAPVQRLWEQGCEDRSLAIFNMVRFFAHKGLPLDEITELVLAYDRRGLGKLVGRDGAAEIRRCYEKVLATRRNDGTMAPPCHSLQRLGFCAVNTDPSEQCDVYDRLFARHGASERDSTAAATLSRGDALQGKIIEDGGCYCALNARGEKQVISSFVLRPTERIMGDDGESFRVDATTDQGVVLKGIRLPLRAFHSKRDLMRHLPSADLQWTGSDNNVQALLRILARCEVPVRRGVSVLGRHEHEGRALWVHPQGVFDVNGPVEPAPLLYESPRGALEARVRYEFANDEEVMGVAHAFFDHVLALNAPGVVLPMLGWFFATAVKPVVLRERGAFPLLFVWGTAGSGKSSMLTEVFWPLVGVAGSDGHEQAFGATETEFAQLHMLAASNAIPVVLDEYKPGDMPGGKLGQLHRFLRRVYRGEVDSRGKRDQSVQSYALTTPVCLAGEGRPAEQALLERALIVNPTRTVLEQQPRCREAFERLRALPLHLLAPRYVRMTLARDIVADLRVADAITARLLAERGGIELPERPRHNLVVMVLGLLLFEGFAQTMDYQRLPPDLGVRAGVQAVLGEVLDVDQRVEDAFDRFLMILGVMAVQGELRHRVQYAVKDGLLHLHLESAHDAWSQHLRRLDHKGETLDLRALRRLAVENRARGGYVTAVGELVYFRPGHDRRRAVSIDLAKTSVVTEADFPGDDGAGGFTPRSSRNSAPN